jgi:hypothetical protein
MLQMELDLDDYHWNTDGSEEIDAHGFLFNDDTGGFRSGTIIGGCVIRWRKCEEGPKSWWLEWAWVAPHVRRRGVFSRHWTQMANSFEGLQVPQQVLCEMKELWAKENAQPSDLSPGTVSGTPPYDTKSQF